MPSSQHYQISKIIDLIIKLNPKSILDIGVGFGKYGVLLREYLELWNNKHTYNEFSVRIDGIEAFADYITPLHKFIYNKIYIGDAIEVVNSIDSKYDLIILIDVLEHIDKPAGKLLLMKLIEKSNGILISTPTVVTTGSQSAVFNNIYEIHKVGWSKKELASFGYSIFRYDIISNIVYIGKKNMVKA